MLKVFMNKKQVTSLKKNLSLYRLLPIHPRAVNCINSNNNKMNPKKIKTPSKLKLIDALKCYAMIEHK